MHFLPDLLILVVLGVVAAVILARLRLPAVSGLLIAGMLAGPHALSLIRDVEGVEQIAEIGVVLLLFTIGIEFSGERLKHLGRIALIGGTLQVLLTIIATVLVSLALGYEFKLALFFGFIVSLSSTAIVLRVFTQRGEIDSPHGRFAVGTLIFQDIAVVVFVLLTPLLAGTTERSLGAELLNVLARAALLVGATLFASRFLISRILSFIDATRSRELFLLGTLAICIGWAYISYLAGLSLALGAFLAGVVIASSDFAHRTIGEISPLRDVLTSLFFISLGMLFDWRVLAAEPLAVILLFLAFVVGKGLIASIAAIATGFNSRIAWLGGVALAQFGEFGYVLAAAGQQAGLAEPEELAPILSAGVLSMLVTPLLIRVAGKLHGPEVLLGFLERLTISTHRETVPADDRKRLCDHIIIAGFGPAGRLLARVLKANDIPYVVFDLNAESVRAGRRAGEPIYYGDILQIETIRHADIEHAHAVVVMFNDPEVLPNALEVLRRHYPQVPVLMRCRFLSQAQYLLDHGADFVAVEEVETGLTMLRRLLRLLGLSDEEMRHYVTETREQMRLDTRREKHQVDPNVLPPEVDEQA